ncbi:hypothetical protein JB92DRAFT_3099740 [Gautieria morchelliformis]|nr:hypothetical protein JB92DRAFT_3099740 [Gautieria morchelliformis]
MSSQDVTDLVWLGTLHQYLAVSAIALYGHDYLITLPQEVILVWGKKMGLGAGAYIMARLSVGVCLTFYLAVVTIPFESLTLLMLLRLWLMSVETILVLRTYAISQNSVSTLIGLSVLAIISVIPGWFEVAGHTCGPLAGHAQLYAPYDRQLGIMLMVFDCVIIGVTVYHFGISRIKLWNVNESKSFISLLLYQGEDFLGFGGIALMIVVLTVVNDQGLPQKYFNMFLSHGQV